MKAVVQSSAGQLGALAIVDREVPVPGDGEVLVRMSAAALNHRDLTYLREDYPGYGTGNFRRPVVPLSDGAGVVRDVGSGVTGIGVGDRVCTLFHQGWMSGPLDMERLMEGMLPGPRFEGVLQEYICLGENGVVPVPARLSDAEAATLPCSGLTAWNALRVGNVEAGEVVLISGTGGVAVAAMQFAKAMGARVAIASTSAWKLEKALEYGADAAIDNSDPGSLLQEVLRLTDGKGVDAVVEAGGGRTLNTSLQCLKTDGTVVLMGLVTGATATLDLPLITVSRRRIVGVNVGSRRDMLEMCETIAADGIRPMVDRVYRFEDAVTAFEDYEKKNLFSKYVIKIGE